MKDPAEIYTKKGTPIIVIGSRILFAAYFAFSFFSVYSGIFENSQLNNIWLIYQIAMYGAAEIIYSFFARKGIDLTFAFPLVLSVYCLNFATQVLGGQDQLVLMNRVTHFASAVIITYVVWVFFIKYLPHKVWGNHPYYTALLVLSVASTMGVANEIIELVIDKIFHTAHVGTGYDTSLDLLMNTLGSGIFLAVRLIIGNLEEQERN